MKKICKDIWNNRLYYPRFNSYMLERVLFICGVPLIIGYLLSNYFFKDESLADFFLIMCLCCWYIPVLFFFLRLSEGYNIQKDCIYFKYRFKMHKLFYKDIKCIIIVNGQINSKIVKTPYVIIIGGEQERILQYCRNRKKPHVLACNEIKYELGAEIGCYHPGNVWEMFKRGSSTVFDYGFMWNQREIHKLLTGFCGKYYVAKSVIGCYPNKFDEIIKKYGINKEQINIFDDSTNGEFLGY